MPSLASRRQQLYRDRRKRGLQCLTLEIRDEEVRELIRRGLLPAGEASDKSGLRRALYTHLDRTLSPMRRGT
jgi:hypothetical protein